MLADGWQYAGWVVGSVTVRAVEEAWPEVGSRIHHAVGAWPVTLKDETQVELCAPSQRLVLIARGRPFGEARVDIRLESRTAGTLVTILERPVSGPGKWLDNPALDAVLRGRNVEAVEAPGRTGGAAHESSLSDGPSTCGASQPGDDSSAVAHVSLPHRL